MTRAQELRAEVSEIAHESFDGAMVVKTLGPRGRGDRAVHRQGPRAARRQHPRRPDPGGVRPDPGGAAQPRRAGRARGRGAAGCLSGATDAGDVVTVAYLLTIVSFPIRSIGWLLGEFPRSVVGFHRVTARARGDRRDAVRRARLPAPTAGGARLERRRLGYAYEPDDPAARRASPSTSSPGRTVALVGATASGKSTLTTLLTRLVDPDSGRILVDGIDLRDLARGELADSVSVVQQTAFLFDDTVRGNVTLGADVTDEEVWAALRAARPTASWPRCPTASTPGWGSAARRCRAASGSGSRWPGRWCAGPGC